MTAVQLVCAVLMVAAASALVVEQRVCPDYPENVCTVNEVRVDPCVNPKSCILKKGRPASISADITPSFAASSLKTGLFWASGDGDVAFGDLFEADACGYTSCPTEAGKTQKFDYSLNLSKRLPKGTYNFKLKIWNSDDISQTCCFMTQVKLR